MKKKILMIIFAALTAVICASSANAFNLREYKESEELKIVDGVVYTLGYGGEAYSVEDYFATDELAKTATEINIVSEIDGKPVRSIFVDYLYRESFPLVEAINIPEGIEYIGEYAFSVLDSVKKVELPESVTGAGEGAFANMKSLEEVTLPEGITYIPDDMFSNCPKLHTVNIEGKISEIGAYAFYACKSIAEFKIPDSVILMGGGAFNSSGLTSILIPARVKFTEYEDTYAYFKNCKALKRVEFEDRYTEAFVLGDEFFLGCTALETVVLPEAKNIRVSAKVFENCINLKNLTNADRIYSLGSRAFYNCGLEKIALRGDVDFDDYAFDEEGRNVASAFESCKSLKTVVFENSDKLESFILPQKTFKDCTALKRVVLPVTKKETIICDRAFYGCASLTSVYNTAKTTEIGEAAFAYCKSLGGFTVPEGVRVIPEKCFYGCEKLKNIYLHDGITKIEKKAFKKCKILSSINYEGSKSLYDGIKKTFDIKRLFSKVKYGQDYQALLENVKVSVRATKAVLSWRKDKNAAGYRIYVLDGNKQIKLDDTKSTSYTVEKLEKGKEYTFFVRAYSLKSGKKIIDPQKECVIITAGADKISGLDCSAVKTKKLTLSWNKAEGASGYRIYIMKDGKWKKLADTKALSYTPTGLEPGREYLFSVRAKEKSGRKTYWSDSEYIDVKTKPSTVKALKAKKTNKKQVTLFWNKTEGADGYSLYRKEENGKWKIIRKHTGKATYTVKSLSPGKTYTFAVRSYTNLRKGSGYIKNYASDYTSLTVTTKK